MEWNYNDELPEKNGFYWIMGLVTDDEFTDLPSADLKDPDEYVTIVEMVEDGIISVKPWRSEPALHIPGFDNLLTLDQVEYTAWAGPIEMPSGQR